MSHHTECVHSELKILMEVGLLFGEPGPRYRSFQVAHGINHVPADLAREWFRVNRRFLECIQNGKIRIVDSSQEVAA
jgi:hypothetical protein